ncbi:MAG: hypothetical protein IKP65_03280 [Alphaproteobacteria bacterium]|nr:hypothetical protein [Alphaproteobacteria bacterium]
MGRKKKEEKSTVIAIRDNFDWGKILFNACYIFNKNFADYWNEYIKKYENGEIKTIDAEKKIKDINKVRDDLLTNKLKLRDNKRAASINVTSSYRKYVKSIPFGKTVSELRQTSSEYIINPEYKKLNDYYFVRVNEEEKALQEEKEYTCNHLFEARVLGNKMKQIKKMINIHNKSLAYPIANDQQKLYDFITSEEQIEKLMGVCLNILDTYSEKDFNTMMNLQDKERVADLIFEYFNDFNHNFDFLAGCYEEKEDGKLYLKDLENLKNKLYNGYYFTIRGYVQRAYIKAREEKFNIQSSDEDWDEPSNYNHGIDKYEINESNYIYNKRSEFDEGMIDFWKNCKDFLNLYHKKIALEFHQKMNNKFENLSSYYNKENTQKMVLEMIDGIDSELIRGRDLGNKFKYIILYSTRGAESKQEWEYSTEIISDIFKKYLKQFFKYNLKENFCS